MRLSRSRSFRFTREGKVFVAVTVGVGIAAVNTGNNLLYLVLGLMLSTLLVSGVLSELVLRRVRVGRALPSRAYADEPCLVEVALDNRKRFVPSFSLQVEDRADGSSTGQRAFFLKVAPQSQQVVAYELTPARRGRMHFDRMHLRTRYPFGLIDKGREIALDDELVVYPARVAVAEEPPPRWASRRMEVPTARTGAGSEVAGVREYQPEDEARAIHWRRTASMGRLVVREHHREAAAHLVLELEGAGDFEQAVRVAASRAVRALSRGSTVEVRAGAQRSPTAMPGSAPDPLLRFLALVEPPA